MTYECIYLHAFESHSEAPAGIGMTMNYYNAEKPHPAINGRTPFETHPANGGLELAG
jgi:putative transposase